MSDRELERIAEDAAERAVTNVLERLGLDVSDPKAVQADWSYIRNQRLISEKISLSVRLTIITSFITGVVGLAWMGVRQALGH